MRRLCFIGLVVVALIPAACGGTEPTALPKVVRENVEVVVTQEAVTEKEVAAFVNFCLDRVNQEIEGVGYFPLGDVALQVSMLNWMNAMSTDTENTESVSWPVLSPQGLGG